MAKEKEVVSKVKQTGKIVIWILAVLGILFVGLVVYFMFSRGNTAGLYRFNALEADYLSVNERFNTEWGLFNPSSLTNTSLKNSLNASQTLLDYVLQMQSKVTAINEVIAEEKAKASGKQLEWWTKVGDCYAKRAEALISLKDLFTNEPKALNYLYNFNKLSESLIELETLEKQSITYGQIGDKQKDIDTLNKMKAKVIESQGYLKEMKNVGLGFNYIATYEQFLAAYEKYVELNIQYYASPSKDVAKQAYDKYKEIQEISSKISVASMNEEYDSWSTANIGNKRNAAIRLNTEADQLCSSASKLYNSAFPNANVIKIFEKNASNKN